MKKVRYWLLIVLVYLYAANKIQPVFANTNVNIQAFASNVCHLYYEIIKDNQPIDVKYKIINSNNEIIIENKTKEGLLIEYNLPFDHYYIVIEDNKIPITLDSDYLTTQHILKQLNISSSIQTNTSDINHIYLYISLFSISFIFFILIYRKTPFAG